MHRITATALMSESWHWCTKFGIDSSSHFPFTVRTQTHEVTDGTDHTTHAPATTDVGNDNNTTAVTTMVVIVSVIPTTTNHKVIWEEVMTRPLK